MLHFWDKSRFLRVIFFFFFFSMALVFPHQVTAQSKDCGNNLPQQLSAGAAGWVIPDPPEAVNVRDAPGGNRVGQIQPAERFIVLDGPECNQTYSWWKIESETGVQGWITEGTDHYFVEPLAVGGGSSSDLALNSDYSLIINHDIQCDKTSDFEVGQVVHFANENPRLFYGNPLLENGFFPVEVMSLYYEAFSDTPFFVRTDPETLYYLAEGSYCVNGENFWKLGEVGSPSPVGDGRLYVVNSNRAYWVSENALDAANLPQSYPAYDLPVLRLVPNTSAPLIDAAQQVAFDAFGGGGQIATIWSVGSCGLGESHTALGYQQLLSTGYWGYSSRPCMEIYPLPTGQAVIQIFQPDGALFGETIIQTHPLTISREIENGEVTLETVSATVDIPDDIGLMTGIWQIEVHVGDTITHRAYSLIHDDLQRIQSFCDGAHPRLFLNAFNPGEKLDLVYVTVTENAPSQISTGDQGPFEEVERWPLEIGDTGGLLLDITFQPQRNGYFVLVEPNANWQENLDFVGNGNPGSMAALGLNRCGENGDAPIKVEANRLITGMQPLDLSREYVEVVMESEQYSFEAKSNDTVTITSATYRDGQHEWMSPDLDTTLSLYAPDGTLLAENDDALTPQFSPLDAEIKAFVIPKDGEYLIVLTSEGSYGITSLLINVDRESTPMTAPEDTVLSIGDQVTALLGEQTTWQFEGRAGDFIAVSLQSGDFDPIVTFKTSEGEPLVTDDDSGDDLNAYFEFTLPVDGVYVIEVSGWGDKTGEYTLEINQP